MVDVTDDQVRAVIELIAGRFRKRRENKDWKQESVAQQAGIPVSHYGSIERADRLYRIDTMIKILSALDFNILDAFKTSDAKTKQPKKERDPVRQRAIEQLEHVLDEGSEEDIQIALGSIARWHKALPNKKR